MITAEQRIARQSYVGSSDAPAICEVDPYRSAADVFLDKTGRVTEWAGNDATEAGALLERAVVDWFAREMNVELRRDVFMLAGDGLRCANLDARIADAPAIVEAKTSGIVGPADAGFGDVLEGPNVELPERVLVQIHHQFHVAGPDFRVAWAPVLIGGKGFRLYRVDRNDELADAVAERCRDFMLNHVRADVPPPDCRPSLDVLKRVKRTPNKTVEIDAELLGELLERKCARLAAEKAEKEAEAAVLAALGDAEAATWPGGSLTYYETQRKGYTVQATTYRQLRLKAAKGA